MPHSNCDRRGHSFGVHCRHRVISAVYSRQSSRAENPHGMHSYIGSCLRTACCSRYRRPRNDHSFEIGTTFPFDCHFGPSPLRPDNPRRILGCCSPIDRCLNSLYRSLGLDFSIGHRDLDSPSHPLDNCRRRLNSWNIRNFERLFEVRSAHAAPGDYRIHNG